MIIFLHGDDSYRLLKSRDEIIDKYQTKHGSGFNFFKIDGSTASSLSEVTEALKSISLFSEVKLVLINNIFTNSQTAEGVYDLLVKYKILADPKIVVLATHVGPGGQAKPKELFDLLTTPPSSVGASKKNLIREFIPLEGVQLQSWLKKEAFVRDATFESGALARFIAVAGGDSWARIQNLDKLVNYLSADRQALGAVSINSPVIDLLIKTETEPNVFEFIDALGSGRRTQAFSLLCGELAFGRDPYYLLTMVMYQFRNMLIVKDFADRNIPSAQIAQKSGMHPFVVKKMLSATSRLPLETIKRLYQEVLDLEQGTKQGRRDLEDGLFTLALG